MNIYIYIHAIKNNVYKIKKNSTYKFVVHVVSFTYNNIHQFHVIMLSDLHLIFTYYFLFVRNTEIVL